MGKEREVIGTPVRSATVSNVPEDQLIDTSAETLDTFSTRPKNEDRDQLKARLAKVLDRSVIQDRLTVNLPSDVHGEWVRNDPMEIARMQTLGFDIDNKYAIARSHNNDGTGRAIVGDVVFMTCSKELKSVIDEIRADNFKRTYSPKREEKEFITNTRLHAGDTIPAEETSSEVTVDVAAIRAAVSQVDSQTQPVR